jgi:hypothetical protein
MPTPIYKTGPGTCCCCPTNLAACDALGGLLNGPGNGGDCDLSGNTLEFDENGFAALGTNGGRPVSSPSTCAAITGQITCDGTTGKFYITVSSTSCGSAHDTSCTWQSALRAAVNGCPPTGEWTLFSQSSFHCSCGNLTLDLG